MESAIVYAGSVLAMGLIYLGMQLRIANVIKVVTLEFESRNADWSEERKADFKKYVDSSLKRRRSL